MRTDSSNLIVARFENRDQAEHALDQVERVLKATDSMLDQGALVARDSAGGVEVVDLKDTAISDIIASAGDLTLYLARETVVLAFNAAVSGLALMIEGTGRCASLAGAVATFPVKKLSRLFFSGDTLERLGIALDLGNAAVVIQVAERHLATLQDVLKTAGGEIVDVTAVGERLPEGVQNATAALAEETADRATRAAALPSMAELEDRKLSKGLSEIEGIGPVISAVLEKHGVHTFADLAAADVERLRMILANAGIGADPATWPRQARLAMRGRWDDLRALQDTLREGKEIQ